MNETQSTNYAASIHYDRRLYKCDIAGSIAHVRMLARQGIITVQESYRMADGLEVIRDEIKADKFPWREDLEDIHMNIERRLHELIGDVAGKLHTARSRNDQIALDIRLYTLEIINSVRRKIHRFRSILVDIARENSKMMMPGYTHLQRAQPVLFAHHMLAYFEMFGRDDERFRQAQARTNVMPLGSGALAGVPYPIDREYVAKELGFSAVSSNSMDAVSDRDFLLDFHSAAATCMVHISRMSEELVLWSSEEFGFVRLGDDFTTGSSIMPQKRNPDFAELARGKTGRVFGHLMGLLTVLKGLPLTYNRDLQEDKEGFFDTADTLLDTFDAMSGMLSTMNLDSERITDVLRSGHMLATDIADYLVAKGLPFREAHGVVSQLSSLAADEGLGLEELSLDTYRSLSPLFEEDVFLITFESSVNARNVQGGTTFSRVEQAIAVAADILEDDAIE